MFGNVQEIIDFHKKYFTPTLRKADGNSEKLLYLLKHRNREMKGLYGKFCINKTKSTYIISQHRDFMEQLRTSAVKQSIGSTTGCTITEKAPTRAFSWLKAATTAFTFKTLC